ncbi:MAG: hypothetical protein KA419_10905 [Acidobacteria bacterium]|nr:hypothetical protein [Acidobacteriota bacterium]
MAKKRARGGFLTLLLLGVGLSAAAGILLIDYSTRRLPGGAPDPNDPVRLPAESAQSTRRLPGGAPDPNDPGHIPAESAQSTRRLPGGAPDPSDPARLPAESAQSTHRLPGGAMDQADPARLPAEGAYGDLVNALDRSVFVLERFNRDLAAARDPKAMSDAMDRLAADWAAVRDAMTAAAARHPELSKLPEPPEALRPVMERVDHAGKGFLAAQIRLADYIRDHPEAVDVIMAAFERLTAVKENAAPPPAH